MSTALAVPFADHLPPDAMADFAAIAVAVGAGRPIDPAIRKRARDEADRVREAPYRRHGLLDIRGPAIRELCDA